MPIDSGLTGNGRNIGEGGNFSDREVARIGDVEVASRIIVASPRATANSWAEIESGCRTMAVCRSL